MSPADDLDLLHRYAKDGCERSFSQLVERHLNLVYSAALRQVRSPESAREVSQSAFVELAKNAGKLGAGTVLPAWLYAVTRRRAIDLVRSESRRHRREQLACELNAMTSATTDWNHIEPLLDEAMDSLDPADRAAILLRYFENRTFAEVGEALGTTEAAAQRRISRAVERLRQFFGRKRLPIAAAGVAAAISANAVQAAPIGLASVISAHAVTVGATAVTATAVTKAIVMTTLQKACIATAFAATIGAGVYEASHASQLAARVQSLEQAQQQISGQSAQSAADLDDANKKLATLESENEQLRARMGKLNTDSQELQQTKLDDDAAANDPAQRAVTSWLLRVSQLKDRFAQNPDQDIPEMKYLDDKAWLNAANNGLVTDNDYRRAMAVVRGAAESDFVSQLRPALQKYAAANTGTFPTDMSQLQPYFSQPVDPAILQRYTIEPASDIPNISVGGPTIITEKSAVDPDFDGRDVVGINGSGAMGAPGAYDADPIGAVMAPVMKAYMAANNGQQPTSPSQLIPYATTPLQQTVLQKVIRTGAGN
jgi:RNA polymerase sigma factor (sigma-70 family)